MAIIINDNIRVNAGKPVDAKYLSSGNTAYTSVAAVNAAITIPERHVGLTVNIMGVEYWYTGVTSSPIQKKYDSTIPSGDFVTGGTNLGFFSGFTGVQTLPLDYALNPTDYSNGNYYSTYGWYYRGTDGIIYAGTPSDGIPKRAYIKTVAPVKSWIWNEFTGSSNMLGWILIDSNVQNNLGVFVNGVIYYPPAISYTQTSWISGTNPNNGSNVTFDIIAGSLTTGITMTVGAPVFAGKAGKLLEFRTLQTKTPNIISVSYDEAFVYVSGATVHGANIGTGAGVYSGTTNNTLQFRTIIGSGDTQVTQVGNTIVIHSVSVTGGTGGTGGGTYNLSTPAAITVGGINAGDQLTGKTSFQLFEELLVPALNPTCNPPFNSFTITSTGLYEIACPIGALNANATFNQGSISPVYCGGPAVYAGLPATYNYSGDLITPSVPSTSLSNSQIISGAYTIVQGVKSWTGSVSYSTGVAPKNSKGTNLTPLGAGTTGAISRSIEGVYPLFATCVNITTLSKLPLVSMVSPPSVVIDLCGETVGNKQKFEIPSIWNALSGVQTWDTNSSQWKYEGSAGAVVSKTFWTQTPSSETIQTNPITYKLYSYNGALRGATRIKLDF
jgi:hypothetical protein